MKYFELHVELKHIAPIIWRRFRIRADASFYDLHLAIQACGWFGGHLWAFLAPDGDTVAGIPSDPDARRVMLADYFDVETTCSYLYDFGDDWEHDVRLLEEGRSEGQGFTRELLGGERNFPPEDCGGIPGYERALEFRKTGRDPWGDEESLEDRIGIWQPDEFDLSSSQQLFEDTSRDDLDQLFGVF